MLSRDAAGRRELHRFAPNRHGMGRDDPEGETFPLSRQSPGDAEAFPFLSLTASAGLAPEQASRAGKSRDGLGGPASRERQEAIVQICKNKKNILSNKPAAIHASARRRHVTRRIVASASRRTAPLPGDGTPAAPQYNFSRRSSSMLKQCSSAGKLPSRTAST